MVYSRPPFRCVSFFPFFLLIGERQCMLYIFQLFFQMSRTIKMFLIIFRIWCTKFIFFYNQQKGRIFLRNLHAKHLQHPQHFFFFFAPKASSNSSSESDSSSCLIIVVVVVEASLIDIQPPMCPSVVWPFSP